MLVGERSTEPEFRIPDAGPEAFVVPLAAASTTKTATKFQLPFSPTGGTNGFWKTQAYNVKNPDFNGYHLGEDWSGGSGDSDLGLPVYAAATGKVVYARWYTKDWGNVVIIQHTLPDGKTVSTLYGHLQTITVKEGAEIAIGKQVGAVGNADGYYAGGAHLHFAVYLGALTEPGKGYNGSPDGDTRTNGYVEPSHFISTHLVEAKDTVAPKLTSSSPSDDDQKVALKADITLKFDDEMKAGSGAIEIRKSDGSLFESIDVGSSRVKFSGSTVTIDPSKTFAGGTGYYLVIKSGVLLDDAGNKYGGLTAKTDLNFTTIVPDTKPPVLKSSTPSDNETKAKATADIVLKFDDDMKAGSGSIEVRKADGSLFESIDVGSSRVKFSGSTVTIDPSKSFADGASYYVIIKSGVLLDDAGNKFSGISKNDLNFTIIVPDTKPPKLKSSSPDDDEKKVKSTSDITLKFDDDMKAGSGSIEIRKADGSLFESIDVTSSRVKFSGSTVTIDPSKSFASGASYYVIIKSGVLLDDAGNKFSGISKNDLSFTIATSKLIAPEVPKSGSPLVDDQDGDIAVVSWNDGSRGDATADTAQASMGANYNGGALRTEYELRLSDLSTDFVAYGQDWLL